MQVIVLNQENSEINGIALTNYYDSIVTLLEKYKKNNAEKVQTKTNENLLIAEIKTIELENLYQNLLTEIKIKFNKLLLDSLNFNPK